LTLIALFRIVFSESDHDESFQDYSKLKTNLLLHFVALVYYAWFERNAPDFVRCAKREEESIHQIKEPVRH